MASRSTIARFDWTPVAFGLGVAYLCYLVAMFAAHYWLLDSDGHVIASDFIAVWAAGKMALAGHAAKAYDWQTHHAAEIAIVGHGFLGYYGWHYPPMFLLLAAPLALLPYWLAFTLWIVATFALYARVIARIGESRKAALWALAFPAALLDAWVGQNGFLTAGLIGLALLEIDERPLLAGLAIGLLTYKPQFGVLIPFVLLATGRWRVFGAASITAIVFVFASWLVFGTQSWIAFFHSIPVSTHMLLEDGRAGWNKLQSIYGFVRFAGGSDRLAWAFQIAFALLSGAGVIALWRTRAPAALKAAALTVSVLLATPYLYIYDFPVLAVAIAFLARHKPFNLYELILVVLASLAVASFLLFDAPVGLAATCFVAGLVSHRGRMLAREQRKQNVALQRA